MSTEAQSTPLPQLSNSFVRAIRPSEPVSSNTENAPEIKKIDSHIFETPETPIDIYEGTKGRPYLADLLDIGDLYGKTELEKQIKNIDEYVLSEIDNRKFTKNKESYQSIVRELQSKLKIDPNLTWEEKIKKLNVYVDVLLREKELQQRKRIIEYVIPS